MRQMRGIRVMLISFAQIVNPKGEMKGSAITGPVGKEAAELWPVRCPLLENLFQIRLITRLNSVSRQTLVSSCERVNKNWLCSDFGVLGMERHGFASHSLNGTVLYKVPSDHMN
jgi:hypothetical protein